MSLRTARPGLLVGKVAAEPSTGVGAWLAGRRKSIAALVAAVLTWGGTAYVPDGHIDRAEWYLLAVALAGAVGVYAVTNEGSQQQTSGTSESPVDA